MQFSHFFSIILSAAYTIFMFNRISFGGIFTRLIHQENIFDINKREFLTFFPLIIGTIFMGLLPNIFLAPIHFSVNFLIELMVF